MASMVEFISGKKNIDTEWESYIAGLGKLNYKDFVKAKQDAFNSMKK